MHVPVLHLLFNFNGRIERSRFWIALLAVNMAMPAILVGGTAFLWAVMAASGEQANIGHWIVGFVGFTGLMSLTTFATTFCNMALTAKRLHDLGRTGFWCLLLLLPPSPTGINMTVQLMLLGDFSAPWFAPGYLILFAASAVFVGVIIVGCLPGQPGANRFGAPPLGETQQPSTPPPVERSPPPQPRNAGPSFGRKSAT